MAQTSSGLAAQRLLVTPQQRGPERMRANPTIVPEVERVPGPVPAVPIPESRNEPAQPARGWIECRHSPLPGMLLRQTLDGGNLIVHAMVASTPTEQTRRVTGAARTGGDLVFGEMDFEIRPIETCSLERVAPETLRQLHYRTRVQSEQADHTLQTDRDDRLDGRARRAVVADGRERLFVLTQDVTRNHRWMITASFEAVGGILQEPALERTRGASVASVMAACRAEASRGAQ